MTLRDHILNAVTKRGSVRTADITAHTGVSRIYAHRILQELQAEGLIVRIGRTKAARYVAADASAIKEARRELLRFHRLLENRNLAEDIVLSDIKRETGIFDDLPENTLRILEYAFTEMLNNAIEHSQSPTVDVRMVRTDGRVHFRILDRGVGAFANVQQKLGLAGELDAAYQFTKGKQTTAPEAHSGEGIFFTSRIADLFSLQSGNTLLLFNNFLPDSFIRRLPRTMKGTSVNFTLSVDTPRSLQTLFGEYTNEDFEFDRTSARIKLYKRDSSYVSRSEARRLTLGLEKFSTVVLDFTDIDMIGQAFADEIFRVWQRQHPHVILRPEHANEAVEFMIQHALTQPQ